MNKQTFYKIRRKSDGLYSKGGMNPRFTKTGKTWSNIGHLKNHFHWVSNNEYSDCEVVTFEMVELSAVPVGNTIVDLEREKELKDAKWKVESIKSSISHKDNDVKLLKQGLARAQQTLKNLENR